MPRRRSERLTQELPKDYGDGAGPLEGMPRPRGKGRWQVAIGHGYYQPPEARTWASFPMTAEPIAVTAYYSRAPSSGTHTVALVAFDGATGDVAVERHSLRERYQA